MKINYTTAQSLDDVKKLSAELFKRKTWVFDLETTNLDTHHVSHKIVGIGFTWEAGQGVYVPFNAEWSNPTDILVTLRDCFESPDTDKIGQNLKFDCRSLHYMNPYNIPPIKVSNIVFDTSLAHYCLYGDRLPHGLDDMTMIHLGHLKIRTKELLKLGFWEAPINLVSQYCLEDTDYTWRLYEVLKTKLDQDPNSYKLFYEIELPVLSSILSMECNGCFIDVNALSTINLSLQKDITLAKATINQIAGKEVTYTSPQKLAEVLYDDLQLGQRKEFTRIPLTKTGRRKVDAKVLQGMGDHDFVTTLLDLKELDKLHSTYVKNLPDKLCFDGNLRAFFNQTTTATGRLASSSPNLQNIPSRTDRGKKIRTLWSSRFDSGKILSADYSQEEIRVLAHLSEEPIFMEAFNSNRDPHTIVASLIYNTPEDKITKEQRHRCKTLNFGIIYGMQARKLSQETKMSIDDAQQFINDYLGKMSNVHLFITQQEEILKRVGYTETIFGRKRWIPKVFSGDRYEIAAAIREAVNHVIQGSCGDIIKIAMRRIHNAFYEQSLKSCMIIQVHDELVFDVHPDELEIVPNLVKSQMESVVQLNVPLVCEASLADNWAEAH